MEVSDAKKSSAVLGALGLADGGGLGEGETGSFFFSSCFSSSLSFFYSLVVCFYSFFSLYYFCFGFFFSSTSYFVSSLVVLADLMTYFS